MVELGPVVVVVGMAITFCAGMASYSPSRSDGLVLLFTIIGIAVIYIGFGL